MAWQQNIHRMQYNHKQPLCDGGRKKTVMFKKMMQKLRSMFTKKSTVSDRVYEAIAMYERGFISSRITDASHALAMMKMFDRRGVKYHVVGTADYWRFIVESAR